MRPPLRQSGNLAPVSPNPFRNTHHKPRRNVRTTAKADLAAPYLILAWRLNLVPIRLNMKLRTKAILALLAFAAIIALIALLPPSQADGTRAAMAASTVSGENEPLVRITETCFRMSPAAATLCLVLPTQSPPHAGFYCHVFANEHARKTILSGVGEYPIGSVLVKQKFHTRLAKSTVLFTIMRKMKSGYDNENGNWEYSVVNSTGQQLLSSGRQNSCIGCHTLERELGR